MSTTLPTTDDSLETEVHTEVATVPVTQTNSYGQILRSSSIIGGATGINYVIGMIRTKVVAVLLGPSGVGLVGLYVSITGLVSTVAQLGIDQSGVREVAEANGIGDPERVARVVKTLRRACWFTGILGWVLSAALAWPLSKWTFGSPERMGAVAILGVTVLVGAVTGGQAALLQGMRRIGDLARIQVLSAVVNTIVAIGLYAWLRERGIVPVIISTACTQLGFSWYFSRRIQLSQVPQTWSESVRQSKRLIGLGAAFMYGALLAAIVGVVIRSMIVREIGLEANGIYQAAWGLSGMFGGFVITAMGADFYPRLTAVAGDNDKVNRQVNEQIEIGVLLALPGVIGTIAFAPLLMRLFYSAKFTIGAGLLPWFVAGVLGMVIMFPMGMIQRAKGATRWIYFGQTEANLIHLLLIAIVLPQWGLLGVGYAFLLHVLIHAVVVYFIGRHLSGFRLDRSAILVVMMPIALGAPTLVIQILFSDKHALIVTGVITVVAFVYSLRSIIVRLEADSGFTKICEKYYLLSLLRINRKSSL